MTQEIKKYNLVSVGHVCHDLLEDKYVLGGSVSYASAFSSSIEKSSAIVTSFGSDFQFSEFFDRHHISVINNKSEATTIFQNVYIGDDRWQYLRSRANVIDNSLIIQSAQLSSILLLCPIADEIDLNILSSLDNDLIGVTIQGWLRTWDSEGKVSPKSMDLEKLSNADFVFLSYEDLGNQKNIIPILKELGNTIVITNDHLGADVFIDGQLINLPSWPTAVVDPTGAGDTFASAFLLKYKESNDLATSLVFGHSAASLIIEQPGMEYFNMLNKIDQRTKAYRLKFSL